MKSIGVYHRPVERFFLEQGFKVFVINPIYGKMHKRNLRKTKTDKEDCFNLVNLFLTNSFKEYIKPDQLYLDLNALSRQYFALDELCVDLKNRYKNLVYLCFPEYELIFKNNTIYSNIALKFIEFLTPFTPLYEITIESPFKVNWYSFAIYVVVVLAVLGFGYKKFKKRDL